MAGLHSLRTRWAAIGAACAVTLGGGTLGIVQATVSSGERAVYVPISPVRVLDTRSSTKVVNDTLRLVVEGTISAGGTTQQVVPTDASAVAINVTATGNQKNGDYGFVTAFPCTSEDDAVPNASSLNFETGVDIANALNVTTSSNGSICLYVYGSAHLIVDVAGYYTDHNHDDRYYTQAQTNLLVATAMADHNYDDRYYTQAQTNLLVDTAMAAPTFGRQIWTKRLLPPTSTSGYSQSLIMSEDGYPLITHYESSTGNVVTTKCDDALCSSSATWEILSAADKGSYLSTTLGGLGKPTIAYYDATNGDLKWLVCTDSGCNTSSTDSTIDGAGSDVGQYVSLSISATDFGVMSYYDATNFDLKVTRCTKANCSTLSTYTVDSVGAVGKYSSLTIGSDGFPVISYFDQTNETLKVAHCNDAACSTSSRVAVGPTGIDVGKTSIAIGVDGLPIIAYNTLDSQDLLVAHCGDASCSNSVVTTLRSAGNTGSGPSLTIGLDGLPLISYGDITNSTLAIDQCVVISCTSATTFQIFASPEITDTSIVIGSDGLPAISYQGSLGGILFAHQTRTSWTKNGWGR